MTSINQVIVQLSGGLGNQLFQYAAARRLAYERNAILKLDIFYFEGQNLREYQLNNFTIQENLASDLETYPFRSKKFSYRLIRRIKKLIYPYYKGNLYYETVRYKFDEQYLRTKNNIYLIGYFQNEKYFQPINTIIRKEFSLAKQPSLSTQKIAHEIENVNSVSLHIRRGDYAYDPKILSHRGLLPLSYYSNAVRRIEQQGFQPHFFIFSDDLNWARENIRLSYPVVWVDVNSEKKDYEDLWLISLCKHHIIANSSFSWWGAWLSSSPNKIVYAPDRWLLDDTVDTSEVIPHTWNRVSILDGFNSHSIISND